MLLAVRSTTNGQVLKELGLLSDEVSDSEYEAGVRKIEADELVTGLDELSSHNLRRNEEPE